MEIILQGVILASFLNYTTKVRIIFDMCKHFANYFQFIFYVI